MTEEVLKHLPARMATEIIMAEKREGRSAEEIRIRAKRRASLTYADRNYMLDSVITIEEIQEILKSLCKNSIYAYKESIANGYISLGNGIRAGVGGSAYCENGKINTVYDITSIIIRIPRKTEIAAKDFCEMLKKENYKKSCLIYAASGIGKTTFLRSVAHILASGNSPLRVCVVDTREELGAFLGGNGLCIDILKGYPKDLGTEIAVRTLNAQIIICDEIFGEKEARALSGAVNCGIPILCSAHAGNIRELITRSGIDMLHKQRVFDLYIHLKRSKKDFVYDLNIQTREEAEIALGN